MDAGVRMVNGLEVSPILQMRVVVCVRAAVQNGARGDSALLQGGRRLVARCSARPPLYGGVQLVVVSQTGVQRCEKRVAG